MRTKTTQRNADQGQAIILVIAVTSIMLLLAGILVKTTLATSQSVENSLVQRYSYRALEAGENAYMNAINADPNEVDCSSTSVATAICKPSLYDSWQPVPYTVSADPHGASPEYYLFGNPLATTNPTTEALISVQVQVVGVAGRPGNYLYSSSVINLQPENGFLNNIWWTNFEAFDPTPRVGSGNYANCRYDWQPGGGGAYTGPGGSCQLVPFSVNDVVNGPVYSNDSIYVDDAGGLQPNGTSGVQQPSFNGPVVTADPNCQFVSNLNSVNGGPNDSFSPACLNAAANYVANPTSVTGSSNHAVETPPPTDTQLGVVAATDGCLYSGPTIITLNGATMSVTSPDTPSSNGVDTENGSGNTNTCYTTPTNPTTLAATPTPIPANGVIFVQTATPAQTQPYANPFDGGVSGTDQQTVTKGCPSCYYGQSNKPDSEGDAFVQGTLSGQLTIGTQNNVVIDGNVTYQDCTWTGTPGQSLCHYNTGAGAINDSLGLIAYNYVEVNHPIQSVASLLTLPFCGALDSLLPPLCTPSADTTTGNVTIEAAILALNQSFVVNNFAAGSPEGTLTVYGSIAQYARGPVGTYTSSGLASGFAKDYTWDPRLALYPPPSYLEPGTPSWGLGPSSVTISGTCPPPSRYATSMPALVCPSVP